MRKKLCLVAALVAVALVGCKKQQSELEFDTIKETAVVSGRATYSLGVDTLSNDYVAEVIKPAAGRMVYIDVPKSAYLSGSQGTKQFTGVVDSMGYFKIEVPVKSNGIAGATLRYEEFTAERAAYLKMENGKPVFEVRMCKFETPSAVAALPTLMPGANKIGDEKDLRYDYSIIDMKDYSEKAIFSGSLLLPYETGYCTGAYRNAANCKVEITLQDGEDIEEVGATDAPKFTYGTMTDANGAFSLNLPIKNLRKGFKIEEVVVVPTGEATFTHYVDIAGKSVQVSGAYKLREATITDGNILDNIAAAVSEVTDGIACAIGTVPLKFVPGYVNGIVDGIKPPVWNEDLAGWVFAENAFKNLQGKATLTGSVALAQEDAFGIGSYGKSAQCITIRGAATPYDRDFVVLTQADGTFAFEIPVEQDNINPGTAFSVELVQPVSIAFTHYKDLNKSVVLKEGQYNETFALRDAEADWNELGDFYYAFAPATAPSTYTTNLAGWFKAYDNDQIYTASTTITAKVFVAKETAYATGSYVGAAGHRVKVTVDYGTPINGTGASTAELVAPVASNGTFTVTIPAKSTTSEYTADNFTLEDDQVEDFMHYIKGGKTRNLTGSYSVVYKFEDKDADWNNKYTLYYEFSPTGIVDSYHPNLAGWYKKDGYEATLTASGKAYIGVEKSFGVGEYQAAKDEVITVNVAELSADLQVPVAANGIFTVSIPAKFTTDEYTLTASTGTAADIDDFIHYKAEGKKMALTGKYQPESPVKPADAKWNEMGTYYFKFDNTGTSVASTYTKDLEGWLVVPSTFTNTDADATGTIKLAAESGFWKGTYEAYANKRVEVKYNLSGKTITQVVLTDQDGAFTCKTYREFGDDAPAVAVKPLDITDIKDFQHYYHVTSPAVMNVEGSYSLKITDKAPAAAWNVTGTHYYKFTPTSSPEDWKDNLVGWYVVPQKKGTANFALYAQKAYLTTAATNHEAKWTNAGNIKAYVTIGSQTFAMAVSGRNLTFSMPTADEIEVGSTTMTVTIRLEDETGNNTAFTFYEDPTKANSTVIYGNYRNANNVNSRVLTAETGNKFELKEAAKWLFIPNSPAPTGWSVYSWDVTEEI